MRFEVTDKSKILSSRDELAIGVLRRDSLLAATGRRTLKSASPRGYQNISAVDQKASTLKDIIDLYVCISASDFC